MYDIIINENAEKQEVLTLENGILVEKIVNEKEQNNIEGNVYLGVVKNVLPGLQAAFVDIGEDKNTFIHLKDILPKVDETVEESVDNNVNIKNIVKPGESILVQVKRVEGNQKGARVSKHISLSGKYLVLMPNASFITVSQKIENKKEQERLKGIFKKLLPDGMGAIIRTSAENKKEDTLAGDIGKLVDTWKSIEKNASKKNKVPCRIYEGNNVLDRILNDLDTSSINSIITDNENTYKLITSKVSDIKVNYCKNFKEQNDIQKQIDESEKRKIWLKCGGFITIDKTEALVAIDVNSGKYIGTKNLEQTVYTVNREATVEIAKQLKLRNIGGIVIIDYIDMHDQSNKDKIEGLLKEELKKDRSKTQVLGFTKLNLLEMTRKHIS